MITTNQIQLIDESLKKIGVSYIDIRYEMTDHIATALEDDEKDRPFEHTLKGYIINHKKELQKINKKFMLISMVNAYKKLLYNMFTIRFLALFFLVYLNAFLLSLFMERDSVTRILFIAITVIVCVASFSSIYNLIKRKDSNSFTHGLSFVNVITVYPSIFMMSWQGKIASDNLVLLYYTVVIWVSVIMAVTVRQLNVQYKLRYNG
jgi:hypothetical protein